MIPISDRIKLKYTYQVVFHNIIFGHQCARHPIQWTKILTRHLRLCTCAIHAYQNDIMLWIFILRGVKRTRKVNLPVCWYISCQIPWNSIYLPCCMTEILVSLLTKFPIFGFVISRSPVNKNAKYNASNQLLTKYVIYVRTLLWANHSEFQMLTYFWARTGPDFMHPM